MERSERTPDQPPNGGPTASPTGTPTDGSFAPRDLALLFDALPDAVLVVDQNVEVIWGNAAASRLVGISKEDGSGLSCLDFVHPDDLQLVALAFTSVQEKDVGTPLEVRIRAGSDWRLVEVVGSPLGPDLVVCMRDITERRRWEVAGDQVAQYRSLLQNSSSLTLLLEPDGTVRSSSAALSRLLGHDQEWLEGRPFTDLVVGADHATFDNALTTFDQHNADERRSLVQIEVELRRRDDTSVPYAVRMSNLIDDPTVCGVVVTGHDISDRVMAEAALLSANSRLSATLESTGDGIVVIDNNGVITNFNHRFLDMWALDNAQLAGAHQVVVLAAAAKLVDDIGDFLVGFAANPTDDRIERHDVMEFRDGRVVERHCLPQRIDGEVVGRVWSFRDVTERRQMEGRLTYQAFHDPLTGLANQARFRNSITSATTKPATRDDTLAVLFIDVDEFKTVNDSLGHSAGDTLLRTIAERLGRCVRPGDTVARLGGDEFAILLEGIADRNEAVDIAERLRAVIREPIEVGAKRLTTTASIGIAYGGVDSQADELLRNADLAMYTAKRAGKDCTFSFTPDMHELAVERLDLEGHLRNAVANNELVIHYQPIYDLSDNTIEGFESLVRWNHPDRGLIGPLAFIPFAEECGYIQEIGEYVLRHAVIEATTWPTQSNGVDPSIAVNVSPRQLSDHRLVDIVGALLTETGLAPGRLILEITEGALMKDPATTAGVLQRMRSLGVRVAVDDFGTGHSSLAYLQRFPVDILKVDGSFVAEVLTSEDTSLARAIVHIATSLGLDCIAEGIESQAQADMMASFGCGLGQGYHLGRPVDDVSTQELLAQTAASAQLP